MEYSKTTANNAGKENMNHSMERFKNTEVAVIVSNQSQLEEFLDLCTNENITFIPNNENAKGWFSFAHNKKIVLICRDKHLTWDYPEDGLPKGCEKFISANEILCTTGEDILNAYFPHGFPKSEPKPAPEAVNCKCVIHTGKQKGRFRIIIDCDGDTTTARMLVDGNTVKKATAKRNPEDKFNWRIGAQTAFNRLWEKKKSAVKEVERHAMPGEWVKVVKATVDYNNEYKNGDILQIVQYWGNDESVAHYKNKPSKFLYDSEYVVLEGYKPE